MCGIAGVVGNLRLQDHEYVRSMCASMHHRGPDSDGYFDSARACLGMRRLAIIDVANGSQPNFSEDGRIVSVLNGEIYNYGSLQTELREDGHRLKSLSDSECIPHLYERDGTDLVRSLRGMFGFAVWDSRDESLLLARDRVGKKPLYYWQEADRLWFGSELKALLTLPGLERQIDVGALSQYLTYQYVPAPLSILQGVRKLPPASLLHWKAGKLQISEYWRLSYHAQGSNRPRSEDDACEELRERLLEATRVRMVSDRPLGAFLSGGMDSSAVVAAMAMQSSEPISTFSVGFEDAGFNELPYARQVAAMYGTNHHEVIVKPDANDLIPRIADKFDEPFADSSALPSFYVAESASQSVVVVLNGDGGDESFGGYDRYLRFMRPGVSLPLPIFVSDPLARAASFAYRRYGREDAIGRLTSRALRVADRDAAGRYGRQISYFTPEEQRALFREEYRGFLKAQDHYALIRNAWSKGGGSDLTNTLLNVDVHTYLPGDLLPKVDITTMSVSLEARSPLLDQELMAWAAALPGDLKVRNGQTKYLMRKALAPWIPADVIDRPKRGFAIPIKRWLQEDLRGMVSDTLLSADSAIAEFLDEREVRLLVRLNHEYGHRSGQVWSLLMLEFALRRLKTRSGRVP